LSDTSVDVELTVVGQLTRGVAGQGQADESRNLDLCLVVTREQATDNSSTASCLVPLPPYSSSCT